MLLPAYEYFENFSGHGSSNKCFNAAGQVVGQSRNLSNTLVRNR
jgi:hypothetical protein